MKEIRRVKAELADREKKFPRRSIAQFTTLSAPFATALAEVEDSLYQTKNRSGQDPLNYPIRLNNRIGALLGVVQSADGRPTQQTYDVYKVSDGRAQQGSDEAASDDQRESSAHQRDVEGGGLKEIESKGPIA